MSKTSAATQGPGWDRFVSIFSFERFHDRPDRRRRWRRGVLVGIHSLAGYQHRIVRVGDIKTHFLEAGSGPDLLLLHGGEYGASAEITWKHSIDALARRF